MYAYDMHPLFLGGPFGKVYKTVCIYRFYRFSAKSLGFIISDNKVFLLAPKP